jgi:hypothetical protein
MFRKLVKTGTIDVEGRSYDLRYFAERTARGARRYNCELLIEAADRIILDDDSLVSLESKVASLLPATIYSRLLAARPVVVTAGLGGRGPAAGRTKRPAGAPLHGRGAPGAKKGMPLTFSEELNPSAASRSAP